MPRLTRRQALTTLGALSLPLDRLLAQSPAPTAPAPVGPVKPLADLAPDLPNFYPMMEWLARENAPKLSFLDPQWRSLDAWKAAARPVLHSPELSGLRIERGALDVPMPV